MKLFYRPAKARIHLEAIKHNLKTVKSYAGNAAILAVIKADAYGHGIQSVATALQQDVDGYGVASIDDVIQLRDAGIQKPITCLSGFYSLDEAVLFEKHNVTAVIYDKSQLQYLRAYSLGNHSDKILKIWLKVDTGMGRLGFHAQSVKELLTEFDQLGGVDCLGILTHFANSDEPQHLKNQQQFDSFNTIVNELQLDRPELKTSMSNSAAILSRPNSIFDLVRPGIMLYGASPIINQSADQLNLQAAMTFESKLISVKHVCQHETVGYGATWIAPHDMTIGVVAVGYGDGYPRHAPTGTPVLVNGEMSQLIGRVSMDLISIDLSEIDAKVGDKVVLWGRGLPIEQIADCAETISYELLCGVTKRVPRIIEE